MASALAAHGGSSPPPTAPTVAASRHPPASTSASLNHPTAAGRTKSLDLLFDRSAESRQSPARSTCSTPTPSTAACTRRPGRTDDGANAAVGARGVNQVTDGIKCAQLYTDWAFNGVGDGSTSFGLFADTRTATNGPEGTERCGRAAIDSAQNQGAFSKLQPSVWRLLDDDGFFVDTPGFNHCSGTATTCIWRKV
ncbi:hypothetical protein [Streptomyces sp. NPDC005262]|uniref:hypothetical protein n=1 Tax=Streptomyces sp. NPDC005262 TaxID=3364710 RepID=UPI0036CE6C32